MDSYTITIAPNDDSGNSTTLVVDTTGDEVRITDVHLHAAHGLASGQIPHVDFALLLKAVAAPAAGLGTITATAALHDTAHPPAEMAEPAVAAPEEEPAPVAPEAMPRPRRARKPSPAKSNGATTTSARKTPGKALGKTSSRTLGKVAGKKAAPPADNAARAYRRMPDDLAAVYQQAGTPAAIAAHYGVPRYTAQGWVRRLGTKDA